MDPVRFGSDVRLLRHRRSWTQARLAREAKVARWVVTSIETGRADRLRIDRVVAVVVALGGRLVVRVMFHGEGLDRLRDRHHAALVDAVMRRMQRDGWLVATEVSFSVYGERGSIDVLAFHPPSGSLLVIEVKSVVPDIGGMLMTLDRKVRLARDIAERQLGWHARSVSRLLVLPELSVARRRIAEHATIFAAALPTRNVAIHRWLKDPRVAIAGLLFLSDAHPGERRRRSGTSTALPGPRSRSETA